MIIDFDRLFKLSSISINFYRRNTSFLLTSASLDFRAAKLLKISLKIVVVGDKIKRQISKLAEVRWVGKKGDYDVRVLKFNEPVESALKHVVLN